MLAAAMTLSGPASGASPAKELTPAEIAAATVHKPVVEYPYEARRQRLSGSGVLLVEIDPAGRVTRVVMAISTGHPILDEAAKSAFRTARFKAGTSSPIRIPISFSVGDHHTIAGELNRLLGKGTVLRAPWPHFRAGNEGSPQEGDGVYALYADATGKVERIAIVKGSGDSNFDEVVEKTLRSWRLGRGPVAVEIPFGFRSRREGAAAAIHFGGPRRLKENSSD